MSPIRAKSSMPLSWRAFTLFLNFLAIIFLLGMLWTQPAHASETKISYTEISDKISIELNRAVALAASNNGPEAKSLLSEIYFDLFEGSGLEAAIGTRSSNLKGELEAQFNSLRSQVVANSQDLPAIEAAALKLSGQIKAISLELSDSASAGSVMSSSFLIIFREGFEAILVISAIVTLLIKMKQSGVLSTVKSAVFWALAASGLTAILFQYVFHINKEQQELIEGLTLALASAILFFVGHWLISQSESQKWQAYIKSHLKDSLNKKNRRALWLTCFLSVYREGAETVLFYQALWTGSPGHGRSFFAGIVLGTIALIVVYIAFRKGALLIPMKPFFRVTSTFLYFLAFMFAGRAIVEMQAGGYVSVTPIKGMPSFGAIGLYPTGEHLATQGFLILVFALSIVKVFYDKQKFGKVALV